MKPPWRDDAAPGRLSALLLCLLAAPLIALLVISEIQTNMLFPIHAVGAPGPLPRHAEHVSIALRDGVKLRGVHIPGQEEGNVILGFGGNAWNASDVAAYLHELYPRAHVIAFHYRGYRPSTGRPSADALMADAPLVYDFAAGRLKPKRIIAVGFSIGSGVAATLAANRKLDGLILVTPFDSLKAAASDLYPWLPVGPFFHHEIAAAAALKGNSVPVAILAGERDNLILPARTDALRRSVPTLVYDRTIAGAGHNDIYTREEFRQAMHEALSAVSTYNQRIK